MPKLVRISRLVQNFKEKWRVRNGERERLRERERKRERDGRTK